MYASSNPETGTRTGQIIDDAVTGLWDASSDLRTLVNVREALRTELSHLATSDLREDQVSNYPRVASALMRVNHRIATIKEN